MDGALWYEWGTYGLNGWGSYDKVSCCFVWKYTQKIAGLQRSTLSNHRMTTGFAPFEHSQAYSSLIPRLLRMRLGLSYDY